MACPDGSVTWFYEQAFAAGAPLDLTNYPERESFSNMTVSTGAGPEGENTATPTAAYGLVGLNGDGPKDTAPDAGRRNGMVQFDLDYSAYTGSEEANILDVRGAHKDVALFWMYALSAEDYNDWYDYLEDPMPAGHLVLELTTDLATYVFFDAGVMDANFHTFKVGWCSSTIDDDFNVAADGSIKVWVDDVEVYSATGLTLFGDTSSATPAECGLWNMAEFQTIGKLTNIKYGEFTESSTTFYDCGPPALTPEDLCNKVHILAWLEWDVTTGTTLTWES